MKTKAFLFLLLPMLAFSGCNGQTKKEQSIFKKEEMVSADTLNEPQVKVNVNKQYDDRGRIIKFDSTYSYYYSYPDGKQIQLNNDSIYSQFRSYFHKTYPDFLNPQFDNIFYNDSLFKYDFFNNDYFLKRFELNKKMFDNMYKQMDSLKRNYMEHNYPGGIQKKKTI